MGDWRDTWRNDVQPRLPTRGLEALAAALATGDPRVRPGTFVRPYLIDDPGAAPECGCPVAFALWQGNGLTRVDEVAAGVDELMLGAMTRSGDRAYSRLCWFTGWVDTEPWESVVTELLGEVRAELARRQGLALAATG